MVRAVVIELGPAGAFGRTAVGVDVSDAVTVSGAIAAEIGPRDVREAEPDLCCHAASAAASPSRMHPPDPPAENVVRKIVAWVVASVVGQKTEEQELL